MTGITKPMRFSRREVIKLWGLSVGVFSAGLLSACGTEGAPATVQPATSQPAPSAAAQPTGNQLATRAATQATPAGAATVASQNTAGQVPVGKKVQGEIKAWYFPFGAGVEQIYEDFRQQFQKENPGATVSLELLPFDNRYPKMLSAVAAGQAPDVLFMTTDALPRFVEAKALLPLDDLLPKEAWDGYDAKIVEQISYQGARWYMPIDRELPVWMYNKAIFAKIGRDPKQPPTSWDDLRDICAKVKGLNDSSLTGWGYNAASATLNDTFYPFLYQAGGRPLSEDGRAPAFNSPAGIEALTFIVEMFDKGWSPQDYLTPNSDVLQSPFAQGRQAVSIQYKQNTLLNIRKNAPDLQYGLTPVLKSKEQWGFGALRSWAISSNAKNKEGAAAFLTFLGRPENMKKHCESFGLEPVKAQALSGVYANDPELGYCQGKGAIQKFARVVE